MVNQELRDTIAEMYGGGVMVFDNPSFDDSIIGGSEAYQSEPKPVILMTKIDDLT